MTELLCFTASVAIIAWLLVNGVNECAIGDPAGRIIKAIIWFGAVAIIIFKSGLIS